MQKGRKFFRLRRAFRLRRCFAAPQAAVAGAWEGMPADRFGTHSLRIGGASALLHGGYDLLLSLNLEYYAYGLVLMMGLQTALLGREALKRSKLIPKQNFTLDEA